MTRLLCNNCKRPKKTCICQFITKINNRIKVVVLQHPNEVSQVKGSLTLLAQSLDCCTVIVGENFCDNEQLHQILNRYKTKAYLLYPHEHATILSQEGYSPEAFNINLDDTCLILIDATWKKAYRMYMLSNILHPLQKIQLPSGYQSLYEVRKTSVKNGLSTLEACCHALELLEQDEKTYKKLISKFKLFNDFLLSFRPKKAGLN